MQVTGFWFGKWYLISERYLEKVQKFEKLVIGLQYKYFQPNTKEIEHKIKIIYIFISEPLSIKFNEFS